MELKETLELIALVAVTVYSIIGTLNKVVKTVEETAANYKKLKNLIVKLKNRSRG